MAIPVLQPAGDSPRRQLELLRFSEELFNVLVRCPDEPAVVAATVHRVVSAFFARAGCLALYEPIAGRFEVILHTRGRTEWPVQLFARALAEGHVAQADGEIAAPFSCHGQACGVLAISRPDPFDRLERQALRSVAQRVGVEIERRREQALDDVLDGLLRKTKPIDVYTHAVRELRRFIRFDHSVSIMTATRELRRLVVRVEKVVTPKAGSDTLVDSPRVGASLAVDSDLMLGSSPIDQPVHAVRYIGQEWHLLAGSEPAARLAAVTAAGAVSDLLPAEGSQLLWPLTFGGQILGVLRMASLRPGAFEPLREHARVLDRFARLLSVTIYRSDLYYQSERQLQAIKDLGRLATHPLPVAEVCAHTLTLALNALHLDVGAVLLLGEQGELNVVAEQGAAAGAPRRLRSGVGISGMVAATGRPMAVPDVRAEPGYVALDDRVRSELAVPITYDDVEVLGVLSVMSLEGRRFREEDEEVISFLGALANQTAVAIKNSGLRAEAIDRFGLHGVADQGMTNADFYQRILDEDQQRRARQEVQQELSRRLMRTERLPEMLNEVVSLCLDRASGDGACLYLLKQGSLALSANMARRGSRPPWLHEYAAGREALDKAAASFADAGADHAWVVPLPAETSSNGSLPECEAVVAPLYGRSRTRGLLCVLRLVSPRRPSLGQNETELLATVAGLAAVAIEKLRQREQMRALHSIDQAIGAGYLLGPVFSRVLGGISLSSPGDGTGYIALAQGVLDPVKPALYTIDRGLHVCERTEDRELADAAYRTMQQEGGTALRRGPKFRRYFKLPPEANSVLAAPVLTGTNLRGVLVFWHTRFYAFTDEDDDWVRALAAEAAIAIEAWERATMLQRRTDQLRAANERLSAASRAKSEFLANMSAELRTPLNAVIGFSRLLLDPSLAAELTEEERVQSLADIRDSGHHLLALINDILDLSKVEAGRMVLVSEDFSLISMMEGVRTVGETLASQQNKFLTMHATVVSPLDCITADPGRVRQILYNLVSNAVKFTPDGGTVTILAREEAGQVVISVQDTGIGIDSADKDRIFEEFQQIDSSASREYPGTGLGLALVRKLVELLGGVVWVDSSVGAGSTFTFTLPR